ncbi:ATP-dependent sacrificial sulfur transferase LarE [Caldicellulosiruptoraceae bacterium PP1]
MINEKLAFEKIEKLKEIIKNYKSVLIAFSGGVDSTFLLKVAHDVLQDKCIGVLAKSKLIPQFEAQDAINLSNDMGVKLLIVERDIYSNKDFLKNDKDRCYYCKKTLLTKLKELAAKYNLNVIAEGSNVDDTKDYRPGMRALSEEGIKSPLMEAGLTKEEIRFLSKYLNLPTYNKPSYACLVTRIPYGEEINDTKLEMIDKAEEVLRRYGLKQLRLRHHGEIARIEVAPSERRIFFDENLMDEISDEIKSLGFKFVALELSGYKTGSMN